jgi:hypothetical protein
MSKDTWVVIVSGAKRIRTTTILAGLNQRQRMAHVLFVARVGILQASVRVAICVVFAARLVIGVMSVHSSGTKASDAKQCKRRMEVRGIETTARFWNFL